MSCFLPVQVHLPKPVLKLFGLCAVCFLEVFAAQVDRKHHCLVVIECFKHVLVEKKGLGASKNNKNYCLFPTIPHPRENTRYWGNWRKLFESPGFSHTAKECIKVGGLCKVVFFTTKAFTLKETNLSALVLLPKSQALWLNPHLPFLSLSCLLS